MKAPEAKVVAANIKRQIEADAPILARRIFGDVPADGERLAKDQFLAMVQRNWTDVNYRQALGGKEDATGLHPGRLDPEAFLNAAAEAGMIPANWRDHLPPEGAL